MVNTRSIALLLLLSSSLFCTAPESTDYFPYKLGSTKIMVLRHSRNGNDSLQLVQLHDNETTAKTVAMQAIENSGGDFLSISNKANRLISFWLKRQKFTFDPNRIFTERGRQETLRKNGAYSPQAETRLEGFAAHLLSLLPYQSIISMHNNTDSAYAITSYLPGSALANDAADLFINPEHDADDFFLTTDPKIFESLKKAKYNVVLQNNKTAMDDGSLSIYYGRQNLQYVNVEAQHGHEAEQARMLSTLQTILKEQ